MKVRKCIAQYRSGKCGTGDPASLRTVLARTDFWPWAQFGTRIDYGSVAAKCSIPFGAVQHRAFTDKTRWLSVTLIINA